MTPLLFAATPLPVQVTQTVRTAAETDWWLFGMTVAGTLASAAVAVFTAVLASRTNNLARETKRMADKTAELAKETLDSVNIARSGTTVADQHHQESQAPILVLSDITSTPGRTMSRVTIQKFASNTCCRTLASGQRSTQT